MYRHHIAIDTQQFSARKKSTPGRPVECTTKKMLITKGKDATVAAKFVVQRLRPFERNVLTIKTAYRVLRPYGANVTGFADHKYIARMLHTKVYFTHPCSSLENSSSKSPTNPHDSTYLNILISNYLKRLHTAYTDRTRQMLIKNSNFYTPK